MTYGEISKAVEYCVKLREAQSKAALQNAAFAAFHGAYLSRVKHFPYTLSAAFPSLFETECGWQTDKRRMARLAERINRQFKTKGAE